MLLIAGGRGRSVFMAGDGIYFRWRRTPCLYMEGLKLAVKRSDGDSEEILRLMVNIHIQ